MRWLSVRRGSHRRAAAIISPGIPSLIAEYGISELVSTFAISLYVLGYGLGPAVFSPLSEIPSLGRSIFYIVPLGLYFCLCFAVAWTPTFVRGRRGEHAEIAGWVPHPPLPDRIRGQPCSRHRCGYRDRHSRPIRGVLWTVDLGPRGLRACARLPLAAHRAQMGPGLGPVIAAWQTVNGDGGVPGVGNWRWAMWTQLIFVFTALILSFCFLPETRYVLCLPPR